MSTAKTSFVKLLEFNLVLQSKFALVVPQKVRSSPTPVTILSKNKRKGAKICYILSRVLNVNLSNVIEFILLQVNLS